VTSPQTTDADSPSAETKAILYLPAELSFVEQILLPAELAADEISEFAALNLEALAPFPIQQLNWGYYCDINTGQICLYAAHCDRIKAAGYQSLDHYTWVLPEFVSLEKLQATEFAQRALWQADLRSPDFKVNERKARRNNLQLTRATHWTLGLILILMLLELLLFATRANLLQQHSKITTQSATAARVEDTHSLVNKLENVAKNELRPIAILNSLNQIRPKNIYFTATTCDANNQVTLDGISQTIRELNQYTSRLTESGEFTLLAPAKFITRAGNTTFTVSLKYLHRSQATPALSTQNDINNQ